MIGQKKANLFSADPQVNLASLEVPMRNDIGSDNPLEQRLHQLMQRHDEILALFQELPRWGWPDQVRQVAEELQAASHQLHKTAAANQYVIAKPRLLSDRLAYSSRYFSKPYHEGDRPKVCESFHTGPFLLHPQGMDGYRTTIYLQTDPQRPKLRHDLQLRHDKDLVRKTFAREELHVVEFSIRGQPVSDAQYRGVPGLSEEFSKEQLSLTTVFGAHSIPHRNGLFTYRGHHIFHPDHPGVVDRSTVFELHTPADRSRPMSADNLSRQVITDSQQIQSLFKESYQTFPVLLDLGAY